MSDIAIQCSKLSKRYRRGTRVSYNRMTELLSSLPLTAERAARRLFGQTAPEPAAVDGDGWFWALRDIDLEVKQGEVLGIIGRNGAGKSTMLKILSRITEPTSGYADLYGRVGSLLEVGTGFHPELTGRENIYLNGGVLGLSRAEVNRKFDEIVAFAEVDKFLETPVKRYSSGMQTRLGFAVAAHLEPEILIVDEVLAVGDVVFQRKCLGKMGEVAKSGRTVLFVSHNMSAVRELCNRAVLIHDGRIVMDGDSQDVVSHYLSGKLFPAADDRPRRREPLAVEAVIVVKAGAGHCEKIYPGDPIHLELALRCHAPAERPFLWVTILSNRHEVAFASMFLDDIRPAALDGSHRIGLEFMNLPLLPGPYTVRLGARERDGATPLMTSADVGFFEVSGNLSEAGLSGQGTSIADRCFPVLHPYRWDFDGVAQPWVSIRSSTSQPNTKL